MEDQICQVNVLFVVHRTYPAGDPSSLGGYKECVYHDASFSIFGILVSCCT